MFSCDTFSLMNALNSTIELTFENLFNFYLRFGNMSHHDGYFDDFFWESVQKGTRAVQCMIQ